MDNPSFSTDVIFWMVVLFLPTTARRDWLKSLNWVYVSASGLATGLVILASESYFGMYGRNLEYRPWEPRLALGLAMVILLVRYRAVQNPTQVSWFSDRSGIDLVLLKLGAATLVFCASLMLAWPLLSLVQGHGLADANRFFTGPPLLDWEQIGGPGNVPEIAKWYPEEPAIIWACFCALFWPGGCRGWLSVLAAQSASVMAALTTLALFGFFASPAYFGSADEYWILPFLALMAGVPVLVWVKCRTEIALKLSAKWIALALIIMPISAYVTSLAIAVDGSDNLYQDAAELFTGPSAEWDAYRSRTSVPTSE